MERGGKKRERGGNDTIKTMAVGAEWNARYCATKNREKPGEQVGLNRNVKR